MRYFAGIDVAKDLHWICVDANADVHLDRAVANTQEDIDHLIGELGKFREDLTVCLDIMGSIATFLEAALLAAGFQLVHVPGITVNRARDGFGNKEAKSDPKDARVIAEQARTRPNLRPVEHDDETTIAVRVLVGRRRDLVEEQTRRIARLRRLVGSIHPGLEGTLDFTTVGPLHLLTRFVTPAEIRRAGTRRLLSHVQTRSGLPNRAALVEIALNAAKAQLTRLDKELEALLNLHPDAALIRSLPGMGAILTTSFIATAGNITRFRSADAMAAAAGLAPVIRPSGYSRTWRRTFGGDKDLKRVFFQSAFCACAAGDPVSKAFYNRKRREGKHHTQALIALARRRVSVLWTMLKTRCPFDPERAISA